MARLFCREFGMSRLYSLVLLFGHQPSLIIQEREWQTSGYMTQTSRVECLSKLAPILGAFGGFQRSTGEQQPHNTITAHSLLKEPKRQAPTICHRLVHHPSASRSPAINSRFALVRISISVIGFRLRPKRRHGLFRPILSSDH